MFRYGILWRILLALLLVGVLIAGGAAIYRTGWAQGYQVGALAANSPNTQGNNPLPYRGYPYGGFWPGYGFPFFFPPFGIFFGIGFFFLIFFLVGGLFRLFGWRRWAGPYGPRYWGPDPRWNREREEQNRPQPGQGGEPPEDRPQA